MAFRLMATAPTDRPIEVLHGATQAVVVAEWDRHLYVWIEVGDPHRQALHRVTGWRPISEGKSETETAQEFADNLGGVIVAAGHQACPTRP